MGQFADLYKLKAWKDLRRWRLMTEPLCRFCSQAGQTTEATVVDHVRPHKGDMGLFLAPSNLQPLCKACHDRHKQRAERAGHDVRVDAEGFPMDPSHPFNAKAPSEAAEAQEKRAQQASIDMLRAFWAHANTKTSPSRTGGVGSVSGSERLGTGGGQSHALPQNENKKGKSDEYSQYPDEI